MTGPGAAHPVGRRRGDDLRSAVIDELIWAAGAGDTATITVVATAGVITLTGEVDTYPERLRAGRAAQGVRGVIGIVQEITVRGRSDAVTDADTARHVGEALWRAGQVPEAVKVAVHDHVVTLSGVVGWQYQSRAAASAVQYAPGIRSVVNLIEVRPEADATETGDAIHAALARDAAIGAARVVVHVDGGVVTLAGTVRTAAERRRVQDTCRAVPGVAVVVDGLHLDG